MQILTTAHALVMWTLAAAAAPAGIGGGPHDLALECQPRPARELLSVVSVDGVELQEHPLVLAVITWRQQRSGDGNGEATSRSDACGNAQADPSSSAERACDGPFSVERCRCERDERDRDDPDDDVWNCTAYWSCDN